MCGRLSQHVDLENFFVKIDWDVFWTPQPERKINIPPGTTPTVVHEFDGALTAEGQFWGYKPVWYKRGPVSNARLDTVLKGSGFWKPLLERRIIVPAAGWYEWTGEKGDKQPWFISPKDERPILMAAISACKPDQESSEETGFAVVTDDAAGGMVDIHDRRPVCLTPDEARAWLDQGTSIKEALELLSTPRPESAFQWWQVTRAVGNSRYQNPDSIEPIKS